MATLGCQPSKLDEADQFRRGVPRQETVTAEVPSTSGQAQRVESQTQAIRGQRAGMFVLTAGVTTMLNGGAIFVGLLVKEVLKYPPSNITEDTAVWGPFADDLDPVAWKVTISRVGTQKYQYKFEGQPKSNPGAPFVTVLSGTHQATIDGEGDPVEGFGEGSFTLDWDARNTLPVVLKKEQGKATYDYSRPSLLAQTNVKAQFRKVKDDSNGKIVDVDYAYVKQPGHGGSMDFTSDAPPQMGMGAAKWAVRSRWQKGGAGRSDVKMNVQNPPASATLNECWNSTFVSTYLKQSWDMTAGYGVEATDCAFTTAEYSNL